MNKRKKRKKKIKLNPIVLAALVLVGGFFAFKIITFLGCMATYGEGGYCWHLTFLPTLK
jgi:hypothetical protein|tara:strand:- start:256 stop:432 length:177 start_codon:yes stop_codon:yes gene_type:complete